MKRSEYFSTLEMFDELLLERTKRTEKYCRINNYDPELCKQQHIKHDIYKNAIQEARTTFMAMFESTIPNKDE